MLQVENKATTLKKIREDVKLHKCPYDIMNKNPLEKLIDTLEKIDCADANFDAQMVKFKEVAFPLMKAMKAFT